MTCVKYIVHDETGDNIMQLSDAMTHSMAITNRWRNVSLYVTLHCYTWSWNTSSHACTNAHARTYNFVMGNKCQNVYQRIIFWQIKIFLDSCYHYDFWEANSLQYLVIGYSSHRCCSVSVVSLRKKMSFSNYKAVFITAIRYMSG